MFSASGPQGGAGTLFDLRPSRVLPPDDLSTKGPVSKEGVVSIPWFRKHHRRATFFTGTALAAILLWTGGSISASSPRKQPPGDNGLAPAPVRSEADRARLESKRPQTQRERNLAYMSSMGAIAAGLAPAPAVPRTAWPAPDFKALQAASPSVMGSADVIVNGPGDASLQSETSIASDFNGVLVAGYNDGRGFCSPFPGCITTTGMSLSGVARSTDGGATWAEVGVNGRLPFAPGDAVFGDPEVKFHAGLNGGSGGFVYASIYVRPDGIQGLSIHTSDPTGTTWTGPIEVDPAFISASDDADKEFMDVDWFGGSDRILLTWTNFGAAIEIRAAHSDDFGTSWIDDGVIGTSPPGGFVQSSIPRFDQFGSVYAAWRAIDFANNRSICINRSQDNGDNWDGEQCITPFYAFEDQILGVDRVNTSPSLEVDWFTGQVYVVYQRNSSSGTGDIAFQTSTDFGTTFTPAVLLSSNPGQDRAQFYPWVAVDQFSFAGNIHVTWLDQDPEQTGDVLEYMHTVSRDYGNSWSAPTPLNDRPFHAGHGNDTSQPNMGDYNQHVAVFGVLHSLWGGTSVAPEFNEGLPSASLISPDTYYDQRLDSQISPPVRISGWTLTPAGANAYWDPNESANLTVAIENYVANFETITGVNATLTTPTAGVTIGTATSSYPNIPPLGVRVNATAFVATLAANFVPGTYVDFVLNVSSNQRSIQLPFRVATGTPGGTNTLITQDFEGATPPALPTGWVHVNGAGPSVPWVTSNTFMPTNAAFHVNNPTSTKWMRLFSPVVTVPTPAAGVESYVTLDFDILYRTEDEPTQQVLAYDGLTVRIADSTGGPVLRSVLAEAFATSITTGTMKHFPKHLPRSSNPLQDMSVWAGDSGPVQHVSMKFPGAGMAGRTVQLRYEYMEDSSLNCNGAGIPGTCGVGVDNVVFQQVQVGCSTLAAPSIAAPSYANVGQTGLQATATPPAGSTAVSYNWTIADRAGTDISNLITAGQGTAQITFDAASPGVTMFLRATATTTFGCTTPQGERRVQVDFLDVPPTHPFYAFVNNIAGNGITSGCGGGNYCPNNTNTRAQMAVFLLRSEFGGGYVPPACTGIFGDVVCPSFFADWIENLSTLGITSGCAAGPPPLYCPNNAVLRNSMAILLLKTDNGSGYVPPVCTGIFGDVTCPSFFADWIEDIFNQGITSGCAVGPPLLYCPTNPVTRGQMSKFLVNTFALTFP